MPIDQEENSKIFLEEEQFKSEGGEQHTDLDDQADPFNPSKMMAIQTTWI